MINLLEKYSPKDFKDIIGNQDVISQISLIASTKKVPHLIISGPSGIGKTLSISCLAYTLYGKNFSSNLILHLSSCHDRGIYAVRTKVKQFINTKVDLPTGIPKLVIMEEADNIHQSSQQALRKMLETSKVSFIFICQNISNLIEPLQSRCVLFHLQRIKELEMYKFLENICVQENIKYTRDGLDTLTNISHGDLRIAVNYLQSLQLCYGQISKKKVYNLTGLPPTEKILDLMKLSFSHQISESYKQLLDISNQGYSVYDILEVFMFHLQEENLIETEEDRLLLLKKIGDIQITSFDGAGYLQLGKLLCDFSNMNVTIKI